MKTIRIAGIAFVLITSWVHCVLAQCSLPVITLQPVSIATCTGTSAKLTVTASGATNYQWCWSGSSSTNKAVPPISPWSGNTTNQLTVLNATPGGAGQYWVRVSNACGTVVSNTATLTVKPKPGSLGSISGSTTVCVGQTAVAYSISGVPNVQTFVWNVSAGAEKIEVTPLTIKVNYTGTQNTVNISVHGENACGMGPVSTLPVTVNSPAPPADNAYSYCDWDNISLTTSGYAANLNWYENNNLIHTGLTYSPTDRNSGNYTFSVKSIDSNGCEGTHAATVTLLLGASQCDNYINWNEQIAYGINEIGQSIPVSASRVYSDGFGNSLQAQSKVFSKDQVLASQFVKDASNNTFLATLAAPVNSNNFLYKYWFVTNENGSRYSDLDFDKPETANNVPGELNNPNAVGARGQGTLGWYYSPANTIEPFTPVTEFPYSRTWIEPGPDPKKSSVAAAGDQNVMGTGHEASSDRKILNSSELHHYFQIKSYFAPEDIPVLITSHNGNAATEIMASNVTVSTVSEYGNTYLKVVSNQTGGPAGITHINGTIPVTPLETYKLRVHGYSDSSVPVFINVRRGTNGSDIITHGAELYRGIARQDWVENVFSIPAGCNSISFGVMFFTGATGHTFYIDQIELYKTSIDPLGYRVVTEDQDGKKSAVFIDNEGKTLATAIVLSTKLNGLYAFGHWNYYFYNKTTGQLIASIAPNGVNTSNTDPPSFVTRYRYDHLGRMIEISEPDQGTTRYVYSLDGKLRFSENQEQRDALIKRFSYTNYDKLGRLIESGEYTSDSTDPYVFEPHTTLSPASFSVLEIADDIGFTGVSRKVPSQENRCAAYTFIEYNGADPEFPSDNLHTAQSYLYRQISKTENANSITWYSYDEFGNVSWTKQRISELGVNKTVDYTYDFLGNVIEVAYQKGNANEAFHHHYEYDADQRLSKVYTSKDGTTKILRAAYTYYLHGPLKRIELGGNVQGIDYVYNIDGSLKLINHPDPALDPGQDGLSGTNAGFMKDVFGEALDYHTDDYTGAGYNAGKVTIDNTYPDQFGGSPKAIRWHSPTDNHIPRAYAFSYDNLYQMDKADWGDMTGSSGSYGISISPVRAYKEDIGRYDKNGNIQSLERRDGAGNIIANYSYNYLANTNKLNEVSHNGKPLLSYQYNAIGQMTQQKEGDKVMNVAYNAHGLVREVRNGSNQLLQQYFYDDRGNRIIKKIYENGTLRRTEYAVYDASGNVMAFYERDDNILQQTEVPIYGGGRIGIYKTQVNTCFYEVADHLGNVRGVIGVPETLQFNATFENDAAQNEVYAFENYKRTDRDLFDHTDKGATNRYAQLLNGGYAGQVGLAKSLKVNAGDKITAEVYAKYQGIRSEESNVTAFATALTSAFGLNSSLAGEGARAFEALNAYGSLVASGDGPGSENNGIKAFITVLLLDNNYNLIDASWKQLDERFEQKDLKEKAPHDHLQLEVTVEQPGFAYVFVSNEHPTLVDVYFDDLAITQELSSVVAGADYYPFGFVMEERQITQEEYRHDYQGQYSEKDKQTGWNQFELRMYDARIGRWLSPDPYGEFYSPYLAMGNSPMSTVDPDGGSTGPVLKAIGGFKYAKAMAAIADDVLSFGLASTGITVLDAVTIRPSAMGVFFEDLGPRLLQGAKNTGDDLLRAFVNSGGFANAANNTMTMGLFPRIDPGMQTDPASYSRMQEAGDVFGAVAPLIMSGGMSPSPGTAFSTSTVGPLPVNSPVLAPTVKITVNGQINASQKPRSYEKPIGKRIKFPSRKKAYEGAKKAGKGEPVLHGDGEHGPHYHPGDGKGKPLNHDHYYFPKSQY